MQALVIKSIGVTAFETVSAPTPKADEVLLTCNGLAFAAVISIRSTV